MNFANKTTVFGFKINLPEASEHYREQDAIEREEGSSKFKDFLEIEKSGNRDTNTGKGKI